MKNNLLATFIVEGALASSAAIAGSSGSSASAQGGGTAEVDSDQTIVRKLLELSHEAETSLTEAIAMAENLHDGSRTVQIGFERSGCPEYRVRTVRGSVIWENTVDARNGRIIGNEARFFLGELSPGDRRNIDALDHVAQGLSEAVQFAERAVAGKAVGGCLIDEDGRPGFAVVVVSGNRLKQVMLDAPA